MTKFQLLDSILVECGFRESMAGTAMLREAILAYAPGKRTYKEIYPEIAQRFETTVMRAERNMRSAVVAAFGGVRCSPEARKYFGLQAYEVPPVGEAIARLHRVWVVNAEVFACERNT